MRMITAAPMTCHQTEKLLRSAIIWPLKMLRIDTSARTTMKMRKTRWSEYPAAHVSLYVDRVRSKNVAHP